MSEIIGNIINGDLGYFLIILSGTASTVEWIIFFIVLALILLIFWIVFCCATRIRFLRGNFYKVTFRRNNNGLGYVVSYIVPKNANEKNIVRHLFNKRFLIPFSEQSVSVVVGTKRAKFKAIKSPMKTFSCRSYPFSDTEANKADFNKGHLSRAAIHAILNRDTDFVFDETVIQGVPCGEGDGRDKKMDSGTYLVEEGTNTIVFFITKKEERELRI